MNARSAGETIVASFFNDFRTAFSGDFVGRDTSGVPAAGQNLGTLALPWGTAYITNLILNGSSVDTTSIVAPANRIVSGKTRATAGSNLLQFIVPNGAAASFLLDGTPTNLVVVINGATTTISTDITKSSLTLAPASNNTALVDDADAADQYDTKFWGSPAHRKPMTIDTAGTEITALIGKWAAFKIGGVSDEYFMAYVESATKLSNVFRGFFYDSSLNPIKATGYSNNDTITLMKLTWIFVENDGSTVDVTYTNPAWSFTAPGSPVTGDYWFDMGNETWKRYDGATFQIINRTFIGWSIQDSTNCVAARCYDAYGVFKPDNSMSIVKSTAEIAMSSEPQATVNVAGEYINFGHDRPLWNITTDLAASTDMFDATEQANRFYYLYLKQNGDTVISDIFPYHRRDLHGWYHPYNVWRCVGVMFNDASSDIQAASATDCQNKKQEELFLDTLAGADTTNVKIIRWSALYRADLGSLGWIASSTVGDQVHVGWPALYHVKTTASIRATTLTEYGYTVNETAADLTGNVGGVSSLENWGHFVRQQGTTAGGSLVAHRAHYLFLGDILRAHLAGTGAPAAGDSSDNFHVSRVE